MWFPDTDKCASWKTRRLPSFLTILEVFENQIKHDFRENDVASQMNL